MVGKENWVMIFRKRTRVGEYNPKFYPKLVWQQLHVYNGSQPYNHAASFSPDRSSGWYSLSEDVREEQEYNYITELIKWFVDQHTDILLSFVGGWEKEKKRSYQI